METQSQNLSTTADHSQYTKTVCQPRCEIFKDYTKDEIILYTVASLDEIDQKERDEVVKYLDPGDDICEIIVSPGQSISDPDVTNNAGDTVRNWKDDWVLILTKENLVLFDSAQHNAQPIVQKTPIEKILSIMWGKILLQSWVDWSWADERKVEHARINFQSSGEKPIIETLGYIQGVDIADFGDSYRRSSEQSQIISALPVKFADQLSLMLTPQEKILAEACYPFQPAVWKSWHGLFKKQVRKETPSLAYFLTERQFVMIYEGPHDSGLSFGTFIQTVKRKNILKLLVDKALDGSQLVLVVGDKNAEERVIIPVPEESFEETIKKFRVYFPEDQHNVPLND